MATFIYLKDWTVTEVQSSREVYTAEAVYDVQPEACPKCGVVGHLYRHGVKLSEFRDAPVHGKQVVIKVQRRRYRCRACTATFLQALPDMEEGHRMTVRCSDYIADQGLKRPFTQVADTLGIDEKTVRLICGERMKQMFADYEPRAPRVLGIDEVMLMKRSRVVLTDSEHGHVLDMLESRDTRTIAMWLTRLRNRRAIEVVTIDMWKPYRDIARDLLPDAAVVVDKWHVMRMASEALEKVRVASQRDLTPSARKLSKRGRLLLLARPSRLSAKSQLVLSGWLSNAPTVRAAYEAKERYFNMWDIPERGDAEAAYETWVAELAPAEAHAFKPLLTAMRNWRREVFAFWDHRITNARTETLNVVLKQVNRAGRGYSFDVLRARVLEMKGQPAMPESQFQCDICRGIYDQRMLEYSHFEPTRGRHRQPTHNSLQLCATCHRFHTKWWFKPDTNSTP